MRLALIAALSLAASSAGADSKPKSETPATATEAKPALCKRHFVGRGLDRKVVCEFEKPIVIGVEPPKPKVLIVPVDARKVVGRPKVTDPFAGLPQRRSTSL